MICGDGSVGGAAMFPLGGVTRGDALLIECSYKKSHKTGRFYGEN